MQQHGLGEKLEYDHSDAKAADMRIGQHGEQLVAVPMRRAACVDQIGEGIEMERAGDADQHGECEKGRDPGYEPSPHPPRSSNHTAHRHPNPPEPAPSNRTPPTPT